ncbi:MAG: ChbG/HpnK family deacetylase [Acidobacteriia bacterium]|nr:ChbG/HpnK family deacetylase [Terriglobia bacterium]
MARIVVSADDFGLCAEINDAICLLHGRGIVQRTSLMVNTDCFEASVDALRRRPALEVGVHLNLTDGRPVLPPQDVPTLVDGSGCFHGGRHYGVIARIVSGRMRTREIHREWRAQIAKAKTAGLALRQLNAHGHLHLLPQLHGIVVDLLREFDIPEVRLVRSFDSLRGILLHLCSLALMRRLRRNGLPVMCPDRTLGLKSPGSGDQHIRFRDLAIGGSGTVELIVHPSKGANEHHRRWGYAGDDELNWLLGENGGR